MKPFLAALLAASTLLAACARDDADGGVPFAIPGFAASSSRAPLGSPVDLSYRFTVAPDAPPVDRNYRVMVHFLDSDEEMMWTDDHDPPVPTTRWKPGETIEYQRTMFVPVYPYVGPATVRMGLYSPADGTRLPLVGSDAGQRAYEVGRLELLPQSENIFLIYKDGWHRAETAPDNPTLEWQWTRKAATLSFRNPRRDVMFYLQLDGRREAFGEPQRVEVRLGADPIDSFEVPLGDGLIRKVPLSAGQLGEADMVDLVIEVDKTFVPSSVPAAGTRDDRELGIRVFHAFVQPR